MRRTLTLLLLLLLASLLALAIVRPDMSGWSVFRWATPESASSRKSASAKHDTDALTPSNPAQLASSPLTTETATHSSPTDRAAAAWLARSQAVMLAGRTKKFGPQIAALMALPPNEAWPRLMELAKADDLSAAMAASVLAIECDALRKGSGKGFPGKGSLADQLGKGLTPERLALLRAIDARQSELDAQRASDCSSIASGIPIFLALATTQAQALHSDDLVPQLVDANHIKNDAEAIPLMRDLAARIDTDEARSTLAGRLLRSADPTQQHEGRALLEALAVHDTMSLDLLVLCLRDGCGHFAGDASAVQSWSERAAGNGSWLALSMLSGSHSSIEAWAWARYRMELAQAGCFSNVGVSIVWLAVSARELDRLDATLSAAQRLEAEARWRALNEHWLAAARANLDCNP